MKFRPSIEWPGLGGFAEIKLGGLIVDSPHDFERRLRFCQRVKILTCMNFEYFPVSQRPCHIS
jgi:hypothetical protein